MPVKNLTLDACTYMENFQLESRTGVNRCEVEVCAVVNSGAGFPLESLASSGGSLRVKGDGNTASGRVIPHKSRQNLAKNRRSVSLF